MAFFFSGLKLDDVMVTGVREGVSNKGNRYVTLSVCDVDGNANSVSTSEPSTMDFVSTLKQGDRVDLVLVVAGGPKRQYAMIARGAGSVRLAGSEVVKGY